MGVAGSYPTWSPDGKLIAYFSGTPVINSWYTDRPQPLPQHGSANVIPSTGVTNPSDAIDLLATANVDLTSLTGTCSDSFPSSYTVTTQAIEQYVYDPDQGWHWITVTIQWISAVQYHVWTYSCLPTMLGVNSFTWSPDSRQLAISATLAYRRVGFADNCVFLYDESGGKRYECPVNLPYPLQSPLPYRPIVYDAPLYEIFRVNANGQSGQPLTRGFAPAWAPDGQDLAYLDFDPSLPSAQQSIDLYVQNLQTSFTQKLYSGLAAKWNARAPVWTPRSTTLTFLDNGTLYFVNSTGGAAVPLLAASETGVTGFQWSQDGRRVVYERSGGLKLAYPGTTVDPQLLVEQGWLYDSSASPQKNYPNVWSPDGNHIVFLSFPSTDSNGAFFSILRVDSGTVQKVYTSSSGNGPTQLTWGSVFAVIPDAVAGDYVYDTGIDANPAKQNRQLVAGPVDPGTGEYTYGVTDLTVQMRSGPVSLRRSYSRQHLKWQTEGLGPGWTHNYSIFLQKKPDQAGEPKTWIFHTSDGSRHEFKWDSKVNAYVTDSLAASLREYTANSDYSVTMRDGTEYYFENVVGDTIWLTLIKRSPHDPFPVYLQYDAQGRLRRITDTTRDENGEIVFGSRYIEFRHDGSGNIVEVCDHRRQVTSSQQPCQGNEPESPKILYRYTTSQDDRPGQGSAIAESYLTSVIDQNGSQWDYNYTQRVESSDPFSKAGLRNDLYRQLLTHVINPMGENIEKQVYNQYGCVTQQFADGKNGLELVAAFLYPPNNATPEPSSDPEARKPANDPNFSTKLGQGRCSLTKDSWAVVYDGRGSSKILSYIKGWYTGYIYDQRIFTRVALPDTSTGDNSPSVARPKEFIDENGNKKSQKWRDGNRYLVSETYGPDGNARTIRYEYDNNADPIQYGNVTAIFDPRSSSGCSPRNQNLGVAATCYVTRIAYENGAFPTFKTEVTVAVEKYLPGDSTVRPENRQVLSQTRFAYTDTGFLKRETLVSTVTNSEITTCYVYDETTGQRQYTISNYTEDSWCDNAAQVAQNWQKPPDWVWGQPPIVWIQEAAENVVTKFEYDPVGHVIKARDHFGRVTKFDYDQVGRQTTLIRHYIDVSQYPTDQTYAPDTNLVTTTDYDAAGRVQTIKQYAFSGATLGISTGQRITTFDYWGATDRQQQVSVEYGSQRVITRYEYDAAGNQTKQIQVDGATERVQVTCYNGLNRVIRRVQRAQDNADLNDVTMCSLPVLPLPPDSDSSDTNLVTDITYDHAGNVILSKDPSGRKTFFVYNEFNQVIRTIANAKTDAYSSADPYLSVEIPADPANDVQQGTYQRSNSADGDIITDFVYDKAGNTLYNATRRDALVTPVVVSCYDGLNRPIYQLVNPASTSEPETICQQLKDGSYQRSTNADSDLLTTTIYDGFGRIQETRDALDRRTMFTYDNLHRLKTRILNFHDDGEFNPAVPDQNVTQTRLYKFENRVDTFNSGLEAGLGEVLEVTDVLGNGRDITTRTVFDHVGRQRWITKNYVAPDWGSTYQDKNYRTTYVYDGLGQPIKITDPSERITLTEYDVFGNPIRIVRNPVEYVPPEEGDEPEIAAEDENVITEGSFDNLGQLRLVSDPLQRTTTFSYDGLGQLKRVVRNPQNGGAAADANVTMSYAYDKVGNRISTTYPTHVGIATDYVCYDRLNRPTRTVRVGNEGVGGDCSDSFLENPQAVSMFADQDLVTLTRYLEPVTNGSPDPHIATTTVFTQNFMGALQNKSLNTKTFHDNLGRPVAVVRNYWIEEKDRA